MRRAISSVVSGALVGLLACIPVAGQEARFSRGDANADGAFDLSDPIYFLSASFGAARELSCEDAADVNDDGDLNVADAVYALDALFLRGPDPAPPHPECGIDPTDDVLGCAPQAVCAEPLTVPPFVVSVRADRQSGIVGTTFNLRGEVAANQAEIVSYRWDLGDGLERTTATADVSFGETGVHVVTLTVRDAAGRDAIGRTALTIFQDGPPPEVSSDLSPREGLPGSAIHIESPVLLEPDDRIELQVGESEPYTPARSQLGVLNAFIPLDAGGRDPTAFAPHEILVTILVEGAPVESFPFQLTPHEPLAGEPGDLLRETFDLLVRATAQMEASLSAFLDGIEATERERAILLALNRKVQADLETVCARAARLLPAMDPDVVALLEYAALGNGMDDSLDRLRSVLSGGAGGGVGVAAGFFDELCRYTAIANTTQEVSRKSSIACKILSVLSWIPGPQQPFLKIVSAICTAVEVVSGIIHDVTGVFLPEMGFELVVTAEPATIAPDEEATITVDVPVTPKAGTCDEEFDIRQQIANRVIDRLVDAFLPGFLAELLTEYDETEDTILRSIMEYIQEFTAEIIDETGVADGLVSLKERVCGRIQDGRIRLSTERLDFFWSVGGMLAAGPGGATFKCSDGNCGGGHMIRAEAKVCGGTGLEMVLSGDVLVECGFPDVAGVWDVSSTCEGCGEEEHDAYGVTVSQNRNQLTLSDRGITKTVAIDCGGSFTWAGSYESDDGILTENLVMNFHPDGTVSGGSIWIWTGVGELDGEVCEGSCTLSGFRVTAE